MNFVQLDDLIAENKRMTEAPDLTVEQYIQQLADRGDLDKLNQFHQTTYAQIAMLFNRQQIMQL